MILVLGKSLSDRNVTFSTNNKVVSIKKIKRKSCFKIQLIFSRILFSEIIFDCLAADEPSAATINPIQFNSIQTTNSSESLAEYACFLCWRHRRTVNGALWHPSRAIATCLTLNYLHKRWRKTGFNYQHGSVIHSIKLLFLCLVFFYFNRKQLLH